MLNRNEKIQMALVLAVALTISGLLAGCSGCNEDATDGTTTDQSTGAGGTGTTNGDDASATGAGGAGGDASTIDSRTTTSSPAVTGTPATPAEERSATVEDMRGMRAILMTELESVRGRLKEAGRPDETVKADQTRAAELAQGLERLDRLIKKIDESDDVSWPTVRESSMSEAAEFRTWMAKYGMQVPA